MANLFATKPLGTLMEEAQETGEHCLKRTLGPVNLCEPPPQLPTDRAPPSHWHLLFRVSAVPSPDCAMRNSLR